MNNLIEKGKTVEKENSYLNCRLFVQLVTEIPAIEDQPTLEKIIPGCILWWGDKTYLHVAIMLEDNKVMQVPEWGGKMEIISYEELLAEWNIPDRIYKSSF